MEQDLRQGSRTQTMTPIRGKSRGPRGEIVTLPGQTAAGRVDSSIRGGGPRSVAPRGHARVWLGLPKTFRYLTEPHGTFRDLSGPFGTFRGRLGPQDGRLRRDEGAGKAPLPAIDACAPRAAA